jgi:hypothetical protein
VPVSITTPGQNGQHTFTGSQNQRVSLNVSGGPLGTVSIRKPDNTVQASVSIGILANFIEPQTLTPAATYVVRTDLFEEKTGTVTLSLYDVPADTSSSITAGGAPVGVTNTTPGQNGALEFAGTTGQRVSLKVSAGPIAAVSLRSPAGATIGSVNSNIVATFIDTKTLSATGTHSILVDYSGDNTGTLTLTLYNVPADVTGSVAINGTPAGISIGTPGQNASLTFSGTASQQVTVHVTGNGIGSTTVKLLKPDGTQLTSRTSSLTNFDLTTQTLPTAGTYTIAIDPGSFSTGSITVGVTSP